MERFDFKLDAKLVYLEDLREQVTTGRQAGRPPPARTCCRRPCSSAGSGCTRSKFDDLMTIIYTSGSTGRPKGVMLSYGNVGSNVAAIEDTLRLGEDDMVCGILPLFHSMGFTVGLWAVLGTGVRRRVSLQPARRQDRSASCAATTR